MNMLSTEQIKNKYGNVSSWAIWTKLEENQKPKYNMGDLSVFDNLEELNLNPNIVLVGLNISGKGDLSRPFSNFHPNHHTNNDYKIRYALQDTIYWGSYMTDIIKDYEEVISGKVMSFLNKNKDFEKKNIELFEEELKDIGSNNPILIAFGNDSYKILHRNLKDKYTIYKVPHYSSYITKEKLRKSFSDFKIDLNNNLNNDINNMIQIKHSEGLEYLNTIDNKSINLILTDPPYIISKSTGMDKFKNDADDNKLNKTENEWKEYKKLNKKKLKEKDIILNDNIHKDNYLKYGTIYGYKYAVKTDYGEWDKNFTLEDLNTFLEIYYSKLVNGGTLILWFDLWKISYVKELMDKIGYKQIRMIEWVKTNPQPLNSKVNYLTNTREIAILGIKKSKPTFNSKYDKGIYEYPIQNGKNKFHPTQKNIKLFEELIKKHSNENDIVLDTFLGGGTTAIACKNTNRQFKGCEINKEYYDKIMELGIF